MRTHPLRFRAIFRGFTPFGSIALALISTFNLAGCWRENSEKNALVPAARSSDPARENPAVTAKAEDVTFAQITDAHLFDAGKRRHGPAVYEEAINNWAALHWAILEINRIEAGGRHIDFVAFTGDWGLENVSLPHASANSAAGKSSGCPTRAPGEDGPVPAVDVKTAAKEVADEFRALVVHQVFLVPGNNDICDEKPSDLHRYAQFVSELQQALPDRVIDLTHTEEKSPVAPATKLDSDVVRGFHLLGLNSASFKDKKNYDKVGKDSPGHPQYEMSRLQTALDKPGSYLIFTHIPDLKDPAAQVSKPADAAVTKKKVPDNKPGSAAAPPPKEGSVRSAWAVDGDDLKTWEEIAKNSSVLGIFAGHFHSSDRSVYGYASEKSVLAVRPDVAAKTSVAPPLAIKFQFQKPERIGAPDNPLTRTARGFLLVTVTATGLATVTPNWYVTLDQKTASDQDVTLAEAAAEAADGHWDTAAAKYAEAMKSTDTRVRTTATAGYVRARGVMRTWWWQIGRYFPPLRWMAIHPGRTIWTFVAVVVLLVSARPKGKGLIYGLGWILKKIFMPRFKGRATILVPTKLTDDAKVDLFASEIACGSGEVKEVLRWFGVSTFGGSLTLLALPSDMANQIIQSFPADVVKGVDITKILQFLLVVGRYFTWRVESRLAFCPDPPAAGGSSGPAGEIRAFASLRWGWVTKGAWCLERRARDVFDLRPTAFALAARILGEALRLRR